MPDLGVGVGFRVPHYGHVLAARPPMDWFEVISENFMVDGGSPLHHLEGLFAAYPVVPHGVSLSLAGHRDADHLRRLRRLVERIDPPWVSDHLCFTGAPHANGHELFPVPYTEALRDRIVDRIREVQDVLGRPFAVENVSSYLTWKASTMPEWAFLAEVVDRADCALLLDVNNVAVSAWNHGFDPYHYLSQLPMDRVVQVHLAGHSVARVADLPGAAPEEDRTYRLDTHSGPVSAEVRALYAAALRETGTVSTLIEWDDRIPTFEVLSAEAASVRQLRAEVLGG